MRTKQAELLEILEKNGRMDIKTIAKMIDMNEKEAQEVIEKLEKEKVIKGYSAIVDWAKVTEDRGVTAMIDVKVTPKRGVGFDNVAERIYRFPEVKTVYLMSGTYDLSILIEGKTMSEVGTFVSEKLSTIDSVLSTTTHFILKKYKHDGVIFDGKDDDKRVVISP
ncbi:Lrp/AsnC family transcriptional regulator [Pseudalkalibacillus caeni]|uniref:Lrp/AsnC family transcriptional regulator n=1 Tax=Exobacillus caeni TaxID=2574798 RepID=A0A5R9FDW5_9BACL|nr:Lrp/AsnC family transcriptional regulator [Pseudalkalibacillus caeni]TLS38754.1 Lrp/AsnC family transcriptional regulator [Pseudalkalibacillus caeni]